MLNVTNTWIILTSWSGQRADDLTRDVTDRLGLCVSDVGSCVTVTSLSVSFTLLAVYSSTYNTVSTFGLVTGRLITVLDFCRSRFFFKFVERARLLLEGFDDQTIDKHDWSTIYKQRSIASNQ